MQLTFRDIEKAFEIDEGTLYQWLNRWGMPAVKANDQYYFNSVEVLEWALKNRIRLTTGALRLCEKARQGQDVITPALMRGGVYFGLNGAHREEILGNVIDLLPLPAAVGRAPLKEMLLSREQLGTTGIGNGIAIPHVRNPLVMPVSTPTVTLCFLEHPIDFRAVDGKPVNTLFTLISPSVKMHLHLLSRLSFVLRNPAFKAALKRQASCDELMAALSAAETAINAPPGGTGTK